MKWYLIVVKSKKNRDQKLFIIGRILCDMPNKKWTVICFLCQIMCDNYVLQWWVDLIFTIDSECFILFAEKSQILLKISVIPILFTFIYLVALNLLVNNQLNSSLRHIIVTMVDPKHFKLGVPSNFNWKWKVLIPSHPL